MQQIYTAVEAEFQAVNALIIESLHSDVELVENIGHYIVDAGGKRLRPLLTLLSAKACGQDTSNNHHIQLAAIIEFIHTATLLHDDVVDVSALRRGRPTANAKWGNAPSVLVGDFLYSRAFQMMVALRNMDIMSVLSDATNIIAEGEVLQLVNAGRPETTEAEYMQVIRCKTATLFEAASWVGAISSKADSATQDSLKTYGLHLGNAFQIVDDVLDYTGDAATLGKNVGDDLSEGKPTLPLIYAMQHSSAEDSALINSALAEKNADNLEQIIQITQKSGALQYAEQQAKAQVEQASSALSSLPESAAKSAMQQLCDVAVQRDF